MCLRSPSIYLYQTCRLQQHVHNHILDAHAEMNTWQYASATLRIRLYRCRQHATYNARYIFNLPHSLFFSLLQSHNLASDPRYKDTFNRLLQRFRFLSTTGMPMAGLSDNRQLETWDTHLQCQQIKEHQCFEPCVCLHTQISAVQIN